MAKFELPFIGNRSREGFARVDIPEAQEKLFWQALAILQSNRAYDGCNRSRMAAGVDLLVTGEIEFAILAVGIFATDRLQDEMSRRNAADFDDARADRFGIR